MVTASPLAIRRAVKQMAEASGKSSRTVFSEALQLWIEAQEEEEDLNKIESRANGPSISWEEAERRLDAIDAASDPQRPIDLFSVSDGKNHR